MLRSSVSSSRAHSTGDKNSPHSAINLSAVPPLQLHCQPQNLPAMNSSALFLCNLIQNGQLAGPAAAALAQVLAVPNLPDTIMFSTGNQQCIYQPGELSAPILVNPTITAPIVESAKSVLTRTPEAIYKEMNKVMGAKGISFPSGFPKGPWKTAEEAKNCFNKCYAQKTSTGCGAFSAIFRSSMVGRSASKGSKKGNRQLLVCDHHGGTNPSQQE